MYTTICNRTEVIQIYDKEGKKSFFNKIGNNVLVTRVLSNLFQNHRVFHLLQNKLKNCTLIWNTRKFNKSCLQFHILRFIFCWRKSFKGKE